MGIPFEAKFGVVMVRRGYKNKSCGSYNPHDNKLTSYNIIQDFLEIIYYRLWKSSIFFWSNKFPEASSDDGSGEWPNNKYPQV